MIPRFVVVTLFAVAPIGCTLFETKTPLYGPKSCTDMGGGNAAEYIAYVPPNANAAVCMPREAAIYITCVRELSQSDFSSDRDRSLAANIPPPWGPTGIPSGQQAQPTLDQKNNEKIGISYSDRARADAFEQWKRIASAPSAPTTTAPH